MAAKNAEAEADRPPTLRQIIRVLNARKAGFKAYLKPVSSNRTLLTTGLARNFPHDAHAIEHGIRTANGTKS